MSRILHKYGLGILLSIWCFTIVDVAVAGTTRIELLDGEKWWGLTFSGEVEQPFTENFEIDLTQRYNGYNFYLPVLMSSAGRYIYDPGIKSVVFDGNALTFETEGDELAIEKSGKSLREAFIVCALKNYPPDKYTPSTELFSLPLYQTWNELGYAQGEEEVLDYAQKLLDEGFPAGVIVICNGWQKVNGSYEFDPDIYPDPRRLVDRLHEMGFKVMLTISPYVPTWGKVYGDAKKNKQLAVDETVDQYRPESSLGLLDMADSVQFRRISDGLQKIRQSADFDGFMFDCGDDSVVDSMFTQNMMSLGQNIPFAVYDRGEKRTYAPYVTMLEAGSMDDDLYETVIENVVSAGLMGFPYSQIRVYIPLIMSSQRSMADYLLLQCGMPVTSIEFAPWRITDSTLYQGVKDAVNFRASIGEYVKELVEDSGRTGEPLVRHMEYQFPRSGFADCADQFMLGPDYLFAPCIDRGEKRMVRFPKGTWIDQEGNKIKGPVVKEMECDKGRLLYYELVR